MDRSALFILVLAGTRLVGQPVAGTAVYATATKFPVVLPANTLVPMALQSEVSTATARPDDFFELKVTKAVLVQGLVAIPENARAVGQVIDSQPGRMGGASAKLVLTIRYVEVDGQRIAMRLHRPSTGEDHTKASLALALGLGPIGLLVRGGNVIVPTGTELLAKVARDTPIQPSETHEIAPRVALPEKETQQ